MDLTLKPIGLIESPYKQKFGTPRQSGLVPEARGKIRLNPDFCPPGCLEGVSQFSHLWVIFQFHKNTNETVSGKVKPPRLNGEKMGLFATRTPHRPNPIGLSVVKVEGVDEEELTIQVSGLDMVDQTPVFDLKPYHPEVDGIANANGGWTTQQTLQPLAVEWLVSAPDQIKALVESTLKRDIRNQEDKLKSDPNKIHKVFIDQFDVWFRHKDSQIEIENIKSID
jgi:tRNA-Thr(GGU) m(6)t(6)A37 methyltransferase TsaA